METWLSSIMAGNLTLSDSVFRFKIGVALSCFYRCETLKRFTDFLDVVLYWEPDVFL